MMIGIRKPLEVVTRFIRCLRGGSQPFLAEASDGEIYVIKFTDNIQGPNLAFNEAAGTELYRACGLSIAPWQPLRITRNFLDRNIDCWMQTPNGRQNPAAGVCFGSRYLGRDCRSVFEVLPGSHFQRIKSAGDFWLAWILDICASHADVRQAIFLERQSQELDAVFIDFGHMFGGPGGDQQPCFRASRYRDERIYPEPSAHLLKTIRWIVHNLNADHLWEQLMLIPQDWQRMPARDNLTACLNRLSDAQFVERSLDMMVDSMRSRTHDDFAPRFAQCHAGTVLPPRLQTTRRDHSMRKRVVIQ